MDIEVEIRSFIDKEKYEELLKFFNDNGEHLGEDYQESYYFDKEGHLRIQRNDKFSKIWLKKGKLHDEQREEIEIKVERAEFDRLESLFNALGFEVCVKLFRKRNAFKWKGISVMVDYTKGYGYIIELEKMADEATKDTALKLLKSRMAELGIEQTPREQFDEKFKYYLENWKSLTA